MIEEKTFNREDIGSRVQYTEGIGGLNTTGIIQNVWLGGYRVDIRDENTGEMHYGLASERLEVVNMYRILYMNKMLGKPGIWGIIATDEKQAQQKFTDHMRSFGVIKSVERDNTVRR